MKQIVALMLVIAVLAAPRGGFAQNVSICGESFARQVAEADGLKRGDFLSTPIWCRSSEQSYITRIWRDYKFKYSTWTGSMGFSSLCDPYKPLNRLYSMMRVVDRILVRANFPVNSYASRITDDQVRYSRRVIDSTQGMCYNSWDPDALATTTILDDVRYHKKILTNQNPIAVNSATVVHEARHAQGWYHTKNSRGASVDKNWAYDGAYKHSVVWLNHLYLYGNIDYLGSGVDVCTEDGKNHRGNNQSNHWASMLEKGQSLLNQKFLEKPPYVFKPKLCGWTLSEQPRNGG